MSQGSLKGLGFGVQAAGVRSRQSRVRNRRIRGRRLFWGRRPGVEALERRDLLASYTTPEDTQLVVADEAFIGAHIASPPLHGTLSLTDVGGFAYKPSLNYNGPDRFIYFVGSNPPT